MPAQRLSFLSYWRVLLRFLRRFAIANSLHLYQWRAVLTPTVTQLLASYLPGSLVGTSYWNTLWARLLWLSAGQVMLSLFCAISELIFHPHCPQLVEPNLST